MRFDVAARHSDGTQIGAVHNEHRKAVDDEELHNSRFVECLCENCEISNFENQVVKQRKQTEDKQRRISSTISNTNRRCFFFFLGKLILSLDSKILRR